MKTNKDIFVEKLQSFIAKKELLKFSLSSPKDKTADLKKLIVTAVELKKGYCLNFVYRHTTKDITKNFEVNEGIALIVNAINLEFNNAEILSATEKSEFIHIAQWENPGKNKSLNPESSCFAGSR